MKQAQKFIGAIVIIQPVSVCLLSKTPVGKKRWYDRNKAEKKRKEQHANGH